VKRIQRKKAAARDESDFDTFASLVNRKSNVRDEKTLSSNDNSLLASMHRDLDAISLQQASYDTHNTPTQLNKPLSTERILDFVNGVSLVVGQIPLIFFLPYFSHFG